MAKKEEKTNVARLLDQRGIPYIAHSYPPDGPVDGRLRGEHSGPGPGAGLQDPGLPGRFRRPLRLRHPGGGEPGSPPRRPKAVGEKSVAMIPQKELLPLTGYVHGGCSPVGMKKRFPTVFHETVALFETICVSAGKIGHQVEVDPAKLMDFLGATAADLTTEEK